MEEIIAELSHTARRKSDINQHSGISVRMSIHNMENLISNALRRAIRLKDPAWCRALPILPTLLINER